MLFISLKKLVFLVFFGFIFFLAMIISKYFSITITKNPKVENNGRNQKKEATQKITTSTAINYDFKTFPEALAKTASKDKTVLLSTADAGYLDMTLNFYIGSIKKHGINNFLMLCTEKESCEIFKEHMIPTHFYASEAAGGKSSRYGSAEFKRKTHIKTRIVLDALKLGYNVIFSDVDLVYLKNPLKHWPCPDCDLQVSSDYVEANSGFYLVKSNKAGIKLHTEMLKRARSSNSNQKTLNPVLRSMKKKNEIKSIQLSDNKWAMGIVYFENQHRMWVTDKPHKDCILIHNNWIESNEAKIYRFKENGLWVLDKDGYYSNSEAKYLTYTNPIFFGKKKTRNIEGKSLASALAISITLGRVLILPEFHCDECKYKACNSISKTCALSVRFHLQEFDQEFKSIYREHVFLMNQLVPEEIKKSQSEPLLIKTNVTQNSEYESMFKEIKMENSFIPSNINSGATDEEILNWFGPTTKYHNMAVLNFHGLYDVFYKFSDDRKHDIVMQKIKRGLVKGGYRQYRYET